MFTPTLVGSGIAAWRVLDRTRDTQEAALAASPQVARETQAFRDRIDAVQTVDDLLDDRSLLKVALGAFGLDEDLNNRAFIKGILESDLDNPRSLANRLADKRYVAMARAFNFAGEGGPTIASPDGDEVAAKLEALSSVDDLFADRDLLRAALETQGLEKDIDNTFFLRKVLESDLADPRSMANRLSDPRYAELSKALGFGDKLKTQDSALAFVDRFGDSAAGITDADALFDAPEVLQATLDLLGLKDAADRPDFLREVLESDLSDPDSVANSQADARYATLAGIFDFDARASAKAADLDYTSTFEKFVAAAERLEGPFASPSEMFADIGFSVAAIEFFGMPSGLNSLSFAERVLSSDPDSPTSLVNVHPDPHVRPFFDAFPFDPDSDVRVYPPGFADAVVERYIDRQFEIAVGESDTVMRIALSLDRELGQIAGAGSVNSRWFGVMASNPMREVFETVFTLPGSFGQLDLDRQLDILKDRSQRMFGTEDVAGLTKQESLDEIRRRYLVQSSVRQTTSEGSVGSAVMSLLANAIR